VKTKTTRINLEGIGQVAFERSRRARTLNLSVRPLSGARVAVPYGTSFSKALAFAQSKRSWLQRRLEEIRHLEDEHRVLLEKEAQLDKHQARIKLEKRLAGLAARNGFSFSRFSVRRQKTRWGSCSSRNDISLNMRIVLLPDHLQDYVILHELMHTKIKNHGRGFWLALNRLVGNARDLDRQLHPYRVLLR
jgi:predicted metal-dependent hydrolase